ncbi:hypothetical protein [Pseudoalteromonas sp. 10-33]|uniref:hypothetical protein n=1 Tax=Pseudoalteromonas sp. 10-33 TaxID=1761890 RepID=UPI0007321A23|nr:hypothetical protein [Pseudoalteromonas sp. 10-33]KTF11564.1 hypothetical protein ATS76_06560 [Pseudoalteromonas sp. 10-33]
MDEPLANRLKQLHENTQRFLIGYNNKDHWQALYPMACKLAEQYRVLYEHCPNALLSKLTLFNSHYSYSANLVISQCVITASLCASQNYDKKLTELYINAALVEHLCVCSQLNKLAEQSEFSANDKKIWQLRHQFAAKIMLSCGNSAAPITHILAKLNKYKQALVNTPKIMLYDGGITLVALANIIAMNITHTPAKKHISFYQALSDLYLRTPNIFAQHLIKSYVAHVGAFLAGSRVVYQDQNMIYLATDKQNRHILVTPANKQKLAWFRVKATLKDNPKQWKCADKKLLYSVWNSEHITINEQGCLNKSNQLIELISQIKVNHEYSFKGLNKIMAHHPEIVTRVCEAVKPYNKEHQAAKDLRHSLSMVGYNNAPAIIQRVVFEQLVNSTPHPLQKFILNRLDCLVKIMALLVTHNKQYQFEHITLPLYAYTHFLLTQCSTRLTRKIAIDEAPNKTLSTPFSAFFGVSNINNEHVKALLLQLLSDNPWANTLLQAEQTAKKQLTNEHKLWVALKVIAQRVFKPELKLTPWQQQTLSEQLRLNGWDDERPFYAQLAGLQIYNNI